MSRMCALFLALSGALLAQTSTGTIVGSVLDPSGLAIGGAEVTLTNPAMGFERRATTADKGSFAFPSLTPGEYRLSVKREGFKTAERRNLNLTVSETLTVGEVKLEVGSTNESVTITAQGAMVQTASAERAGLVTSQQVEGLLIRGRNFVTLLQLLPGVVDTGERDAIDRTYALNVQGGRGNTMNVTLDGMTAVDIGNNNSGTAAVGMDAIAEVKVLLTNYQAEYGRMAGGNVQLVTKSGTRQFHGMGSYFKRHEQFNANSFFNNLNRLPTPRTRLNVYSYNIGGPVRIPKTRLGDKLFFFWSQEFWPRQNALPVNQLTTPTQLERNGDFSQTLELNGALIPIFDPTNGQAMPGNRIPANRIDPNGRALMNIFPLPNFTDRTVTAGRYNYLLQTSVDSPQRLETFRTDYQLHPKSQVSFSISRHRDQQTGAFGIPTGGANWEQMSKTFLTQGTILSARNQSVLTPTLVNEFTFGYSRRPEHEDIPESELRRNQRDQIGFTLPQLYPGSNPLKLVPNATFGGVSNPINLNMDGRTPLLQT